MDVNETVTESFKHPALGVPFYVENRERLFSFEPHRFKRWIDSDSVLLRPMWRLIGYVLGVWG